MAELREKHDIHAPLEKELGFLVKNLKSFLLRIIEPGLLIGAEI